MQIKVVNFDLDLKIYSLTARFTECGGDDSGEG